MASPDILDFEALARPIDGESPSGTDLRADGDPNSVYYQIKDARASARSAERAAMVDEEASVPAEWRTIKDLAPRVLAETSKDLEIVAWLIEALVRTDGFAGLRDGFRAARVLVEGFWDGIYPRPDEDGVLTTVAPLTGLNGDDAEGTLIVPINRVHIVEGRSGGLYAFWEYQSARAGSGAVTIDMVHAAVGETPPLFFETLVADLEGAIQAFSELNSAFDARCGPQAPPSSNVKNALEEVLEAVRYLARDYLTSAPEEPAEAPGAEAGPGGAPAGAQPAAPGELRSRDEAFKALVKVADFFRRTEPHSPLSYQLEQAVRWGRMPLPDLLEELIPDESARDTFRKLTGIREASAD